MLRADFPYACVDLLVDHDGNTWLSEINLRGGLKGAQLTQEDYLAKVEKINSELLGEELGKEG
jgi:ribosomal protein S6--L-glutamate ligase